MSMKTTMFTLLSLTLLSFTSCGPSAAEQAAAEKQKMDSTVKATEEATKNKIETKLGLENSIKKATEEKEMLEAQLSDTKGELAAANDKLNSIKEFQFGRSQVEREQQIKDQTIYIDDLEKQITDIESKIAEAKESIRDAKIELKNY